MWIRNLYHRVKLWRLKNFISGIFVNFMDYMHITI